MVFDAHTILQQQPVRTVRFFTQVKRIEVRSLNSRAQRRLVCPSDRGADQASLAVAVEVTMQSREPVLG